MDALEHPVERRGGENPGRFESAAQRASYVTGSPPFFGFCLLLVCTWLGTYVFGGSRELTHAAGVAMTATTLLLVALLKNSELRSERAIQEKLDAIAAAMLKRDDAEPALDRAIGLEEEL